MMVLDGSGHGGRVSGNHGSAESCLIVVAEAAAMRRAKNFMIKLLFIICNEILKSLGFWGFGEIGRASCRERV